MTASRETGAIHDIGYRRYDGPRLGPTYIGRCLFVHSLRGAFGLGRSGRSKVMPLLLLAVITLPALIIAAIVIIGGADELPLQYTSYAVTLQLVVSIFVAAQAPQSVSRDLRFRVVALYFSRPLSRRAYVHAKFLAMAVALFAVMATPLLVLYGGTLLAEMPFWENTRGVALGLAGAAVFALVLAAAVITVLVVLGAVGAAVQGIADEQGNRDVAGWAGLISPFSLVDGVQVWAFDAESATVIGPPGAAGGPVFALVTLAVVAGCYGLLLLRYRQVSVL